MKTSDLLLEVETNPQAPTSARWRVGTLTYTTGGLTVLFVWLLWGDFAFLIRDRIVPPIIQLLFKKFGASDMLTALLFSSLPALLGIVVGPIVGHRSDRLRSRWGRRIPFVAATIPFVVLSMGGLAFSSQLGGFLHHRLGAHSPGLDSSILLTLGFFWTLFELSCITAISVFGALINDVVPQNVMGRMMGLFRALSLIAGMMVNYWLMGKAETAYAWIFLGVALVNGIGFTLMCMKVKEGDYPPPTAVSGAAAGPLSGLLDYFRNNFGRPYYLWFFAATTLAAMATGPFNLYAIFYAKSVGMGLDDYGKCLALTYAISLCLAWPLAALADRFHPLRLSLGTLALYALVMLWGTHYVKDARTFAIVLIAHGVVAGAFLTVSASLPQRLLPRSRFAEIASAGGIIGSLAWMTLAPVVGTILDFVHHDYRYTFHVGFAITVVAVIVTGILQSRFMALGGPEHYRAPE